MARDILKTLQAEHDTLREEIPAWVTEEIPDTDVTVSRPATEATPAGEQGVLPGAERISDAELAQRKADEAELWERKNQSVINTKPAKLGILGAGMYDKHIDYLKTGK